MIKMNYYHKQEIILCSCKHLLKQLALIKINFIWLRLLKRIVDIIEEYFLHILGNNLQGIYIGKII